MLIHLLHDYCRNGRSAPSAGCASSLRLRQSIAFVQNKNIAGLWSLEFKAMLFALKVLLLLTLCIWTDWDREGQWLIQQITDVGRKGPRCPVASASCWNDHCRIWFSRLNRKWFVAALLWVCLCVRLPICSQLTAVSVGETEIRGNLYVHDN